VERADQVIAARSGPAEAGARHAAVAARPDRDPDALDRGATFRGTGAILNQAAVASRGIVRIPYLAAKYGHAHPALWPRLSLDAPLEKRAICCRG
jgi:hypothetical protein